MAKDTYEDAATVTPNDGADLTRTPTQALYVSVAGNASLVFEDGTTLTINGMLIGEIYPFRVTRVRLTGTTATVIALY